MSGVAPDSNLVCLGGLVHTGSREGAGDSSVSGSFCCCSLADHFLLAAGYAASLALPFPTCLLSASTGECFGENLPKALFFPSQIKYITSA